MGIFELCLFLALLAVYRGTVGTYCAIKSIDPPWIQARKERMVKQAITGDKRGNAYRSERTLRGFFGRLWGDLWEDVNHSRDERRAWRANGYRAPSLRERLAGWRDAARGRSSTDTNDTEPEPAGQEEDPTAPAAPIPDVITPAAPTLDTVTPPDPQTPSTPTVETPTPANPETTYVPDPDAPAGSARQVSVAELQRRREQHAADARYAHEQRLAEILVPDTAPAMPATVPARDSAPATETSASNRVPGPLATVTPINKGETPPMSDNVTSTEQATVQTLNAFADSVITNASVEWPARLEQAQNDVAASTLSNDPAIPAAIGQMSQAAEMLAAAGEQLKAALSNGHQTAAEHVSGLGDRAASTTSTYQNQ